MNLHEFRDPRLEVARAYIHAYYHMERTELRPDGTLHYTFGGITEDMDARSVFTYINRALEWDARGRPTLPRA